MKRQITNKGQRFLRKAGLLILTFTMLMAISGTALAQSDTESTYIKLNAVEIPSYGVVANPELLNQMDQLYNSLLYSHIDDSLYNLSLQIASQIKHDQEILCVVWIDDSTCMTQLDAADESVALFFTSTFKAYEYAQKTLDNNLLIMIEWITMDEFLGVSQMLPNRKYFVDASPYRVINNAYVFGSSDTYENISLYYSLYLICLESKLNYYLDIAERCIDNRQYDEAGSLILTVIQYLDSESPRAHYLMGHCALAVDDMITYDCASAYLNILDDDLYQRLKQEMLLSSAY